jgi:MYXO-CTERM domain-containing protein
MKTSTPARPSLYLTVSGLLMIPTLALGAAATLPFTVQSGPADTTWRLTNAAGNDAALPFNGTCDDSIGLGIEDATSASGAFNAYDLAYPVFIDNVQLVAPDPVDLTDTTVTTTPVSLSGLDVVVEYYFSQALQAARIRAIFENPTDVAIDTAVAIPVNLGSDQQTTIEMTSSGNQILTTEDRWIVTSNNELPDPLLSPNLSEPVNTTVLYGTGSPQSIPTFTTTSVFDCFGPEGIGAVFDISVPPMSTRSLMFFAGLGSIEGTGNTVTGAIDSARQFDDNATIADSLLQNLTQTDLEEALNWDFAGSSGGISVGGSGATNSCSLGTGGAPDPLFALLVVLAGVTLLRRRRAPGRLKVPPGRTR